MYQHILVPVDDSALSITTVGQAVALARRLDARITFFHARPDFSATSDGAVLHAMSPKGPTRASSMRPGSRGVTSFSWRPTASAASRAC